MTIAGYVATEFEPVLDVFAQNFDERGEVGAAVSVYLDGRPVVDLWGGLADPAIGAPWREDTLVLVYSATKGVTAVCANVLIERGLLDPEAAVATIWPEFGARGKDAITVAEVMSHQAGLPYVEGDFTLEESLSWTPIVEALAAQAPIWEPGTKHGYHMRTYGWLVGELIRRADRATAAPACSGARRSPIRSASTSGSGSRNHSNHASRSSSRLEPICARRCAPSAPTCCSRACSPTPAGTSTTTRCGTRGSCTRVRAAVVERDRERARPRPPLCVVRRRGRRETHPDVRNGRARHRRTRLRQGRSPDDRHLLRSGLHAREVVRRPIRRERSGMPARVVRSRSPIPTPGSRSDT